MTHNFGDGYLLAGDTIATLGRSSRCTRVSSPRIPEQTLPVYLWDLRAQVESQLRLLTGVQRLLDDLPVLRGTSASDATVGIVRDLSLLVEANGNIREVSALALSAAQLLHNRSVVER